MINRRDFLGLTVTAGATLTLNPQLLRALQQSRGKLIQRAIPSSGEMVPVVGVTFANHASCAEPAALKEVLKTAVENGVTVLDTYHGNDNSEQITAAIATELGLQNKIFLSGRVSPPGPPQPGPEPAKAHIQSTLARFNVSKIDLAMVNLNADPSHFDVMKEAKKEGRVRYIGVSGIGDPQIATLETMMRNEPLDFIGVRYGIDYRIFEDKILPLAQERKIAVMAYFPFGGNSGMSCVASGAGLFARVAKTPLPEWAADFGATTWAQFFLKYVISHPAVTIVRAGTSKSKHMLDNIDGGIGRLPDEATRKRMAALFDSIPAPAPQGPPPQAPGIALSAAILDRYVGSWKTAAGMPVTFRRDGVTLWVKPGNNPEAPLAARSETRFEDPRGPAFEFQVDAQGSVTGVTLEQGTQRMPLVKQ